MRIALKNNQSVVIVIDVSFSSSELDVTAFAMGYTVGGVFEWRKSKSFWGSFGIKQPLIAYCVSVTCDDDTVGTFHVDCTKKTVHNMVAFDMHAWTIIDDTDPVQFNPFFGQSSAEKKRRSLDDAVYKKISDRYRKPS